MLSNRISMSAGMIISYAKLIATILIWGGVYHVAKFLVGEVDVYTVSFVRFFLASSVLLLMYFAYGRKSISVMAINKQQWWLLLCSGGVGIFLYNLFFFNAERLIAANNVVVIYSFTPCLTVILCKMVFKTKVSFLAWCGIGIALFGTIMAVAFASTDSPPASVMSPLTKSVKILGYNASDSYLRQIVGEACAVAAAICMAIFNIINKKASAAALDTLTITTFSSLFGGIMLAVCYSFYGEPIAKVVLMPWSFWWAMGYTAILATVFCYKWYSDAIKDIGVGQTAIFLNGVSLSTILIGVVVLHQPVHYFILIAGGLIVCGVLITNIAVTKGNSGCEAV